MDWRNCPQSKSCAANTSGFLLACYCVWILKFGSSCLQAYIYLCADVRIHSWVLGVSKYLRMNTFPYPTVSQPHLWKILWGLKHVFWRMKIDSEMAWVLTINIEIFEVGNQPSEVTCRLAKKMSPYNSSMQSIDLATGYPEHNHEEFSRNMISNNSQWRVKINFTADWLVFHGHSNWNIMQFNFSRNPLTWKSVSEHHNNEFKFPD